MKYLMHNSVKSCFDEIYDRLAFFISPLTRVKAHRSLGACMKGWVLMLQLLHAFNERNIHRKDIQTNRQTHGQTYRQKQNNGGTQQKPIVNALLQPSEEKEYMISSFHSRQGMEYIFRRRDEEMISRTQDTNHTHIRYIFA